LLALDEDASYRAAIARECGVIVAENASKFGPLSPAPGVRDFSGFDRIVAFGQTNGMAIRGHTLVWHQQTPDWLQEDRYSPDQIREILAEHIRETVGRYRGHIESWDVVNEAVADDATMRDTLWSRALGPDYLEWAFRQAHEADPAAELVYNDYSVEETNPKSDAMYAMVRGLLERGTPTHAVGLQAHLEFENPPNLDSVRQNIRRFRELGLGVLVTEMDIRIPEPFTPEKRQAQGEQYESFVRVCREEGVHRVLTWGLTDRYSWVPGFFTGTGEALPLDAEMNPKPAHAGIRTALA